MHGVVFDRQERRPVDHQLVDASEVALRLRLAPLQHGEPCRGEPRLDVAERSRIGSQGDPKACLRFAPVRRW